MTTLATRLRDSMLNSGLSPAELSRRAKVSRATVSQWLSGQIKAMNQQSAQRVAEVLGVDPFWLNGLKPNTYIERCGTDATKHDKLDDQLSNVVSKLLEEQKQEVIDFANQIVEKNRKTMTELIAKFRDSQ